MESARRKYDLDIGGAYYRGGHETQNRLVPLFMAQNKQLTDNANDALYKNAASRSQSGGDFATQNSLNGLIKVHPTARGALLELDTLGVPRKEISGKLTEEDDKFSDLLDSNFIATRTEKTPDHKYDFDNAHALAVEMGEPNYTPLTESTTVQRISFSGDNSLIRIVKNSTFEKD
jgi:hypothetical protein